MTAELSDDDRGKTVVSDTERIGTVTDVRGGTAYVDPDWDHVPEDLRDALGWAEGDDHHTIDEDAVTAVQNSQIRIREDLPSQ
ncbi:PRC-barrel domain containing protein [Halorussus sp. AFM4]|uniref:PRC-barrel domain containing protein n=1 Tax=Halorussus sp. AFM4 TaxID=3421651 RepID=UPI003EC12ED8